MSYDDDMAISSILNIGDRGSSNLALIIVLDLPWDARGFFSSSVTFVYYHNISVSVRRLASMIDSTIRKFRSLLVPSSGKNVREINTPLYPFI